MGHHGKTQSTVRQNELSERKELKFSLLYDNVRLVIMAKEEICPNSRCGNKEKIPVGSTCQTCGTTVRELGFMERARLLGEKGKLAKAEEKIERGEASILFSEKMSDNDLFTELSKDMMNLMMHEAGTGWMRAGTLLSGSSTDQMLGAGFKALIDQNKIIIRQNELNRRLLQRLLEKQGNSEASVGQK